MDRCLLEQCNMQISFEMEIIDVSHAIATMEVTEELNSEELRISNVIFSLGLKTNNYLSSPEETPTTPVREGITLPKNTVPMFDGDPLK